MALTDDPSTPDWATFLTRRLDTLVGLIRDRSVKPAIKIARGIIVGLLASVVGGAVLVLVVIGLIHLLDTSAFGGRSFITDFIFGGILLLAGTFLLHKSAAAGRAS